MPSRRLLLVTLAAVAGLAFAGSASAASRLLVGAAEDASKSSDPVVAKAKMDLARLAGLNTIRLTALWSRGLSAPSDNELLALHNAIGAAQLDGIRPIVSVYNTGGKTTPLTASARSQFARFAAAIARDNPSVRDFIIGNEPNLNRFWMPQFKGNGSDAAAPAYEALLARTYDELKRVQPKISVIGGSISPRGADRPRSSRPTHSPVMFIRDLGRAYRRSGRTKPIMDAFAFHPYPESSRIPPTVTHPRGKTIALADYPRLVSLLGQAFNGTAQVGSRLPIVYDEFGVQSAIPTAKESLYTNVDVPSATDAVAESVQASYYRRALALSACQRTVKAFLIFHVSDEADLDRWQSGLYYADDTPKKSLAPFKRAIEQLRAGKSLGRCPKPPKHK